MAYYSLPVVEKRKETNDCHTLGFEIPFGLRALFCWRAGQYVRVKLNIAGKDYRRCFSITSLPEGKILSITVKSNGEGQVSDYLNQELAVGQRLEVSLPQGLFSVAPQVDSQKHYHLFAAGIGITPLYAIAMSVLTHEPKSRVSLLYGSQSQQNTIFYKQLAELSQRFEGRLTVCHCFTETGLFGASPWRKGRIDAESVQAFLAETACPISEEEFYICGPGDFNFFTRQTLSELSVKAANIFEEHFGLRPVPQRLIRGSQAQLQVEIEGHHYEVNVSAKQTLLEAMKAHQIEVPHLCEAGVCGACACHIDDGKVEMINNIALSQEEVEQGQVLTCQSVARTERVKLKF